MKDRREMSQGLAQVHTGLHRRRKRKVHKVQLYFQKEREMRRKVLVMKMDLVCLLEAPTGKKKLCKTGFLEEMKQSVCIVQRQVPKPDLETCGFGV